MKSFLSHPYIIKNMAFHEGQTYVKQLSSRTLKMRSPFLGEPFKGFLYL